MTTGARTLDEILPVATYTTVQWAEKITLEWRRSVEAIVSVGRLLCEAKAELGHGEFMNLINDHLPWGPRTAERFTAIAQHPVLSNPSTWTNLPCSLHALAELGA